MANKDQVSTFNTINNSQVCRKCPLHCGGVKLDKIFEHSTQELSKGNSTMSTLARILRSKEKVISVNEKLNKEVPKPSCSSSGNVNPTPESSQHLNKNILGRIMTQFGKSKELLKEKRKNSFKQNSCQNDGGCSKNNENMFNSDKPSWQESQRPYFDLIDHSWREWQPHPKKIEEINNKFRSPEERRRSIIENIVESVEEERRRSILEKARHSIDLKLKDTNTDNKNYIPPNERYGINTKKVEYIDPEEQISSKN